MTQARIGALAATGAALFFGSSFVATAFALRSFGPLPVAFWRGLIAAILVGIALRAGWLGDDRPGVAEPRPGGGARSEVDRYARLVLLGLLGGPLFNIALNVAVGEAGATITAFVAGLYAVLAAVLAPLVLRERLGSGALAGFIVALVGTGLLAELEAGAPSASGIATALFGAFSFAAYLVLSRRWSDAYRLRGGLIAEANFVATSVVALGGILILGAGPIVPSSIEPVAAIAVLWLALGPGTAAQLLLVASVRRIAARRSAAFLLLNPVTATILAAILLAERLSTQQLIGGALVLAGMALASGLITTLLGRDASQAAATAPAPQVPPAD
ncbi:MAG TPA: DMT family transporter [Candidatus Acidoferrum sp.]|nr:DMT family transporter [Candidatus Acidoferrum sp.]